MSNPSRDREIEIQETSYGWVIVAVAFLAHLMGFGVNASIAVFIGPWEETFGWPRADISLAYSLATVGAALGGIFFGTLSDRLGAKRFAFLGAFTLGGGLLILSQLSNLTHIYIVYFVMGAFGFGPLFTPLLALAGLWFANRKGLAIGIVTAGGAIGQGAVPFSLRLMTTAYDWRWAALALGIVCLALLVPAILLLRAPPVLVDQGREVSRSDHNLLGLPHKLTLPWLALAGAFCCICMAVPLVHLVPLATDIGFSPQIAAGLLFALMASGTIGRVVFGLVADRVGGLYAYFTASFGQTAIVYWLTQTENLSLLFVLVVIFGFFFAGVMTSLLISAREAAPMRMLGFGVAFVSTSAWLGMAIGSYQAGYFYDLTGGYTLSYANAAFAGIINLAIVGLLIWYRRGRSGQFAPATA